MTSMYKLTSAVIATMVLLGCGIESPKLLPKAVFPKEEYTEKPTDFAVFNPMVDILFVIDDSGSMSGPQDNLRRNAYLFADAISRATLLDYHIGVVTTDMDNHSRRAGRLSGSPLFVDKSTTDMVSRLSQNMVVGINGSATEVMFEPILAALSAPLETTYNQGFYRKDAYLAVIFLTDADDQGNYQPADFLQRLIALKGDKKKVLGYGVIRTKATEKSCPGSEDVDGRLEEFLASVTNGDLNQGNILSLCAEDYGLKLAEFAKDIVNRSAGTVKLNRLPVERTIKVTYGTQVIPNDRHEGWVYDRSTNSLFLAQGITWNYQGPGVGVKVDFEVIDIE